MRYELVVVGASLGGLRALRQVFEGLPGDFRLPLVIAQHRSRESGDGLRMTLQRYSSLRLREPQDKEEIQSGRAYLAPADYHLLVEPGFFSLSTEGVVSYARPSIDVLFQSAADAYGKKLIALVLTGANHDGAQGAASVKHQGGYLMVQDPETAESPVLPNAVLATSEADRVLPLSEVAPRLIELGQETHD